MHRTAVYDVLTAEGARLGPCDGAESALVFSSAENEYRALREGAAVYDLGARAKFVVTGGDRVRWLNGMVSNNIKDLATDHGNYNFLLNAQGHIVADLYIYNRGHEFWLDTGGAEAQQLRDTLDRFIIADDVELLPAELTAIGIAGPLAKPLLNRIAVGLRPESNEHVWGDELQWLEVGNVSWRGEFNLSIIRVDTDHPRAWELWLRPENAPTLWRELVDAGFTPVGMEALELARIAAGRPLFGRDIRDRDLPQETAQDRALNFHKGCYIGQEIVERIHSRGNVHRRFLGFVPDSPVRPGDKITRNDKEVGEVTSAGELPQKDGSKRAVALGYARDDATRLGAEVFIAGVPAVVVQPPFDM
jgi:folate-binding protein YgfZ